MTTATSDCPRTPGSSKQSAFNDRNKFDVDEDDEDQNLSSYYVTGSKSFTIFLPHQLSTVKALLQEAKDLNASSVPRRLELKTE